MVGSVRTLDCQLILIPIFANNLDCGRPPRWNAFRCARRISSKLPLCDSRIGDNVKKRGWSLGWVLSGATRVSKEKFSFLSGLEIQPKQTRRFIELSVMKMNPLLLMVILLLVLSGPYVNAGPVGNFFKKVGQSISKPLQSQPASASASVDAPSTCEDAARHAATHFASSTCGRRDGTRSRTTITPLQRRRGYWHCAEVFQPRIWKKQKLVCPMEFRSQAGKAWSRVLICRKRTSISMSPILRPGPS